MTNRDFFKEVANANINEEMTAHANKMIEQLDKRNEKRKNTISKTAKENIPIKETIMAVLDSADGALTAKAMTKQVNEVMGEDYSVQKVSSLLTQLCSEGKAEKGKPEKKLCTYQVASGEEE